MLKALLVQANTHVVGYIGLASGAAVVGAVSGLFVKLRDPGFLIDVVGEHERHEFGPNSAALAALCFGVIGAVCLAVLSSYFGRPATVPQAPSPPKGST